MTELEYKNQEMPLVRKDDDGIRPAGTPDRCFYCGQEIDTPHLNHCVAITKKVRVKYEFTLELEIPWSWSREDFEAHRNLSSWCADNALSELDSYQEELDNNESCWCCRFKATYIDTVDDTPRSHSSKPNPTPQEPHE